MGKILNNQNMWSGKSTYASIYISKITFLDRVKWEKTPQHFYTFLPIKYFLQLRKHLMMMKILALGDSLSFPRIKKN